jgi:anti-anti-sigma factor
MSDLTLEINEINNDIAEIQINGTLNAATYEEVENCLQSLYQKNCYKIIFNLEFIEYISSAGAGVFIQADGDTKEGGGSMVLLNPSDSVKDVFEPLGLFEIFSCAQSLEESVKLL